MHVAIWWTHKFGILDTLSIARCLTFYPTQHDIIIIAWDCVLLSLIIYHWVNYPHGHHAWPHNVFPTYSLTHAGITVQNVTTNLPPVGNRTDGCAFLYSCPFNNRSSFDVILRQPCVYTVEVTMVFKGSFTVCFSISFPLHSSWYDGMHV